MQKLFISGVIGRDAELRTTSGGDSVAGFSVAVDNGKDKSGNKRDATWYDCSLWGKRGQGLCQYLTKGSRVSIMGRPTVRVHEGKAYQGVSIDEISLLGGGNQSGNSQRQTRQDAPPQDDFDLSDEIPF